MRSYAVLLLAVLLLSALLQPQIELLQMFLDKARLDIAVQNAGRSAVLCAVEDTNRANLKDTVVMAVFEENFNQSFRQSLKRHSADQKIGNLYSADSREGPFDAVTTTFKPVSANCCEVTASCRYRYKTRHLKAVQAAFPETTFELKVVRSFMVRLSN